MTYRRYATDADRILLNVTVSLDGCWEWQMARDANGYSRLMVRKILRYGHRFAYEVLVGPIPEGLHLDHLCRVRHCVNPDHLEPVTSAVNQHRGVGTVAKRNAGKAQCDQGHPFDEANTRIDSRGCRVCRTCNRERCAAWREARDLRATAVPQDAAA